MTDEQLDMLYEDIQKEISYEDMEKRIDSIMNETTGLEMRARFGDELVSAISSEYGTYGDSDLQKDEWVQMYIRQAHYLKYLYPMYESIAQFYLGNYEKCMQYLDRRLETLTSDEEGLYLTEDAFFDIFYEPFKDAFDGFWEALGNRLSKAKVQDGLSELCFILAKYFMNDTDEEDIELLIPFSQKYPSLSIPKELLAGAYYSLGMWKNAIAYYHIVEKAPISLSESEIYDALAWSHSKIKNYKQEEFYYRKCLEINRTEENIRNNLGYCLLRQKRYDEALPLFEECLREKADLPYAANNYVRTLIGLERYKTAKEFIDAGEFRVSKGIIARVERLIETHNTVDDTEETGFIDDVEDAITAEIEEKPKPVRFSSEKILEDELTARIESGKEVFGLKLSVYDHDDYYGRQYPFRYGRLDLLCEDEKGDLYIIELKKDAGYSDVFKQVSEYLDYFEKAPISDGKQVHGIICLNSPSEELIEKVRTDNRIRLFEYQVTYCEIK